MCSTPAVRFLPCRFMKLCFEKVALEAKKIPWCIKLCLKSLHATPQGHRETVVLPIIRQCSCRLTVDDTWGTVNFMTTNRSVILATMYTSQSRPSRECVRPMVGRIPEWASHISVMSVIKSVGNISRIIVLPEDGRAVLLEAYCCNKRGRN